MYIMVKVVNVYIIFALFRLSFSIIHCYSVQYTEPDLQCVGKWQECQFHLSNVGYFKVVFVQRKDSAFGGFGLRRREESWIPILPIRN